LTRARLSVAGVEQPIVPEWSPSDSGAPSQLSLLSVFTSTFHAQSPTHRQFLQGLAFSAR